MRKVRFTEERMAAINRDRQSVRKSDRGLERRAHVHRPGSVYGGNVIRNLSGNDGSDRNVAQPGAFRTMLTRPGWQHQQSQEKDKQRAINTDEVIGTHRFLETDRVSLSIRICVRYPHCWETHDWSIRDDGRLALEDRPATG